MRTLLSFALVCALGAAPLCAQTMPMSPIPGVTTGDPDITCFFVMAAHASNEKKAGRDATELIKGAGFFSGVMAERYRDDKLLAAAIVEALKGLNNTVPGKLVLACTERQRVSNRRLSAALPASTS